MRARIPSPSFPWHWTQVFTGCSSSKVCVAGIREPQVASSRNGGFKRQEVLDIRRTALRPLPLGRLLVGNRFRGGIHVAVKFASSAKKNGFNCVSPLMRLHRDATNGQAQTVRSASAKKYPARQFSSPSGVGHRMLRLLIFLRYPISIGRDARRRCAGFVQTQRL